MGERSSDSTVAGPAPVSIAPLPSIRTAEPFERLRDRADAHFAKTGTRPRIFLANLGPIAAFTARSTFAKNFFEAGGIEAITNDGFSDQGKLRQAYLDSKAKLCCICSTDEIYEKHAVETAETLRSAGSTLVYLAGARVTMKMHGKAPASPLSFSPAATPSRF